MRLQGQSEQVNKNLDATEMQKLASLGKTRSDYEKLVSDLEQNVSKL
jgi:hypothetical protein